jgi:hypothetical protein
MKIPAINTQVAFAVPNSVVALTAALVHLSNLGYRIYEVSETNPTEAAIGRKAKGYVDGNNQYDYLTFKIGNIDKPVHGGGTSSGEVIPFEMIFELPKIEKPETYQLNDNYTAEINVDGSVQVGCQRFTADVIIALAKIVKSKIGK